jgi:hypothetical protein
MAGPVQWTIDQLWSGLQQIRNGFNSVSADLKADQAQLTSLWSATKRDTNAARRAANQALLQPLIHQNSVLRLSYLAPIKANYDGAVARASSLLKKAGYTTPNLSGLGFVFEIAPATAVVLVTVALAALATVVVLTQAQRTNTSNVARILGDPSTTPEQKKALLEALNKANKSLPPPLIPNLDFGAIAWGLAAVAAIVIVPKLLPARRAT